MSVSVIISNLNGACFLPRMLETLEGQRGVHVETTVVERESKDGLAAILAKYLKVIVVTEPPLTGLVGGHYSGYQASTKEHLLYS